MIIRVADIRADVDCPDERLERRFSYEHAEFASGGPAHLRLELRTVPPDEKPPPPPAERDSLLAVNSGGNSAWFDFAQMSGAVHAPRERLLPVGCTFLSTIYSHLLLRRDGLAMHAAAVVPSSEAVLLVGAGQAGKTTLATLCPRGDVVHDDLTLLRRREDGRFWVHPSPPWTGEMGAQPGQEPVAAAGVFFLQQADHSEAQPLPLAAAVARLLVTPYGLTGRSSWHNLLDRCQAIASQMPCFELSFARDASAWQAIDQALEGCGVN
ncbi:MAG: hypothetical protein ACE5R4_09135 [Armatimonadota bacterium]